MFCANTNCLCLYIFYKDPLFSNRTTHHPRLKEQKPKRRVQLSHQKQEGVGTEGHAQGHVGTGRSTGDEVIGGQGHEEGGQGHGTGEGENGHGYVI